MPISQVIGIPGSLIGTTATLLGAWVYIQTKRPPKMELLTAGIVIGIILVTNLGLAVLISRETNISINGQKTIPVPTVPVPVPGLPGPSQPGPSPTSTPTPSPTSTPSPAPSPSPTPAPSFSPTPTSQPIPSPGTATPKTSTTVTLKQRNF